MIEEVVEALRGSKGKSTSEVRDSIRWSRQKDISTRQMLVELKKGDVYMKMDWKKK